MENWIPQDLLDESLSEFVEIYPLAESIRNPIDIKTIVSQHYPDFKRIKAILKQLVG